MFAAGGLVVAVQHLEAQFHHMPHVDWSADEPAVPLVPAKALSLPVPRPTDIPNLFSKAFNDGARSAANPRSVALEPASGIPLKYLKSYVAAAVEAR